MNFDRQKWASTGATVLFVLLWSSGALFSRLGLAHASPFVFLVLRFALASGVLLSLSLYRRRLLPAAGTRWRVSCAGALMIGGYAASYLLALAHGVTPGVLATILGVQPLLTLLLLEREGVQVSRLAGLLLAFGGLALVVSQGWQGGEVSRAGLCYALVALACITAGSILQKGITQSPLDVLPLQYACSLVLCALVLPTQPVRLVITAELCIALLWLGLVISIAAQLLLFRLMQKGSLVSVTSLFYLVPATTAVLDYAFFGNRMSWQALVGLGTILAALLLVFRTPHTTKLVHSELRNRRAEEG